MSFGVKGNRFRGELQPETVYELECENLRTALAVLMAGRDVCTDAYRFKAQQLAEVQTRKQVGLAAWDRYRAALDRGTAKIVPGPLAPSTRSQRREEAAQRSGDRAPSLAHYVLQPPRSSTLK